MTGKFSKTVTLVLGVVIIFAPLFAHHGNAAFDAGKRIELRGVVTEWFWANPHCILQFDVKDDSGQLVHWVAEMNAPPSLVNYGWSKGALKPGDQVTVAVQPAKNGRPIGRVLEVVLPDGQKLKSFQTQP